MFDTNERQLPYPHPFLSSGIESLVKLSDSNSGLHLVPHFCVFFTHASLFGKNLHTTSKDPSTYSYPSNLGSKALRSRNINSYVGSFLDSTQAQVETRILGPLLVVLKGLGLVHCN